MRVDGKPEGLRQSMAWLHTWSGLLLGWLLYAVFFTGTLSYFVDEVTDWMRPELHASVPQDPDLTAQKALERLQTLAPEAGSWTINLPNARQTAVEAMWRPQGAQGREGTQRVHLDAQTGEVIPVRETRGGSFLYRFHFELYAMPRNWARWIVGFATMVMLVAIVSGVITHKKIFTDFFTFRPRKGQRSWLDAHNALAVLALPFHIVITFSGLLLLMTMLMPWGAHAVYDGEGQRFNAERRGMVMAPPGAPQANAAPTQNDRTAPDAANGRAPRGERGAGERQRPAAMAMAPIAPMLAVAHSQWGQRPVGTISVQNPNTARATVELREDGGRSLLNRGMGDRLVFSGATGELQNPAALRPVSTASAVMNSMVSVHLGRFADPAVRWLLFLSGVIGTFMAATGMVMWVVKRLPERRKLGFTPRGHRLVEVLNVAAISGLSVAVAAYFWSNRLVAADVAQRSAVEIQCFFWVWLLCLVHAVVRPHAKAWKEQMALAAVAFGLLPLLNAATGGAALWHSIPNGQWSIAGFDCMMLALAGVHAAVVLHLWQRHAKTAAQATPPAGSTTNLPSAMPTREEAQA